jgi:hypothetical protein
VVFENLFVFVILSGAKDLDSSVATLLQNDNIRYYIGKQLDKKKPRRQEPRGFITRRKILFAAPLTPTLSPQAGRGGLKGNLF